MGVKQFCLKWRGPLISLFHAGLVVSAYVLAYLIRFDGAVPASQMPGLYFTCMIAAPLYLVAFVLFGVNRGLWRYVNIHDAVAMTKATAAGFALTSGVLYFAPLPVGVPRSVPVLGAVLVTVFMAGFRLTIRLIREGHLFDRRQGTPVIIYGAGDAGNSLLSDMKRRWQATWQPVAVVDDDASLTGAHIGGVPILGTGEDLPEVVPRTGAREIIIALPSVDRGVLERVVARCQATGLPVNTLPSLRSILLGNANVTDIRPINLESLLTRDPVHLNLVEMARDFEGKRVLVTGGGGSIGSELCRQLSALDPEELIILDRYENGLAAISLELAGDAGSDRRIRPVIGDVTDAARMEHVFARFRPHYVFHAAAHKHVPMMEWNPLEAIKNNVVGTRLVAQMADRYRTEHFTLVSTDKAVNPTNVMGATKRIAEYVVKGMDPVSRTSFCAVRFGNVLGSNGSVVPIFQQQIKTGGPVTVTDPEIRRYFMTIPEAVQLVIRSACISRGGEIFVLDMGEQVKIVDLARRLISMSGAEPERDIEIRFTGLRPGEKLYEELFDRDERVEETEHPKLRRARGGTVPPLADLEKVIDHFLTLPPEQALEQAGEFLHYVVPHFRPEEMRLERGDSPWAKLFPLATVLSEEQAAQEA